MTHIADLGSEMGAVCAPWLLSLWYAAKAPGCGIFLGQPVDKLHRRNRAGHVAQRRQRSWANGLRFSLAAARAPECFRVDAEGLGVREGRAHSCYLGASPAYFCPWPASAGLSFVTVNPSNFPPSTHQQKREQYDTASISCSVLTRTFTFIPYRSRIRRPQRIQTIKPCLDSWTPTLCFEIKSSRGH